MTNFRKYEATTTKHVYEIDTPVNLADLNKIMAIVANDFMDTGRTLHDDSIKIDHGDNELIIYWEEETRG